MELRLAAASLIAGSLVLAGCASTPATAPSGPAASTPTQVEKKTVTVFAAASLTAAFTDIGKLDPNLEVRYTFDGSPTLVDQIKGGAPADVLATADQANMTKALDGRLVQPDPTIFATNVGVLIVPKGNPGGITGLDASLDGKKLVICAPAVPCGAVAANLAMEAGVELKPVSEEQKVTDVRGKVASGEADAGIVFSTDAKAAGDDVETIELQGAVQHATRYPMSPVVASQNQDAAQAFIELVTSEKGRAVLTEYGFGTP